MNTDDLSDLSLPLSVIDHAEDAFYNAQGMFGTDAGVRAAAWVGFQHGVRAAGGALADAVAYLHSSAADRG